MHLSTAVAVVLAAASTASLIVADLNSTKLSALIAGAGPVITQSTTFSECLAVLPVKTQTYPWHINAVFSTLTQTRSAVSEEQTPSERHIYTCPDVQLPPPHGFRNHHGPMCSQMTRRHRTITPVAHAPMSQPITSSELTQITMHPRARIWDHTSLAEDHSKKHIAGAGDHPLTISTTWKMATRKWHGPFTRPKATLTVTASTNTEEKTMAAEDVTAVVTSVFQP